MTRRTCLSLVSIWMLALGACSSDSDAPEVVAGTDGSVPIVTGDVPDTSGDTSDSVVTFGAGTFQLVDPAFGLELVPISTATVIATFEGTRDGVDEQWSQTETSMASVEAGLAQFRSERTGTGPFVLEHVTVAGVEYDVDADGSCSSTMTVPDAPVDDFAPRRHPVEMLFGFAGGEEVGTETIGAVETTHYTFDASALGIAGPTTADGDVWVATTDGYVVRYSLVIDGSSPYLGRNVTGRYTLDYELAPLDAPPAVVPPDSCPSGAVSVTPPADATDLVNRSGLQTFTTPGTIVDLQAWYDGQLLPAGWTATSPLIIDNTALLAYERPGERLSVSIEQGTPTQVTVLVVTTE